MDPAISATWGVTGAHTHRLIAVAILLGVVLWAPRSGEGQRQPQAVYDRAEALARRGDLRTALRAADAGASAWRDSPDSPWYWSFRLERAEILLAQGDASTAVRILEPSPSERVTGRERVEVRILKDRAQVAQFDSNNEEAIQLLDSALRRARESSLDDLLPEIEVRRSSLLIENHHAALSEAELHEAAAIAERRQDRYWQATALGAMGFLLLKSYRYDEALEWFERSLEISGEEENPSGTALAFVNMGWCYYRLGDLDKAEKYFAGSVERFEKLGRWFNQEVALGNLGSARYSRQDYQNALGHYQQALASAEKHRFEPSKALWLNNIAQTYIEMGDLQAAESYNGRAMEMQARLKDTVISVLPMLNAAEIAVRKGNYRGAEQILEQALAEEKKDPNQPPDPNQEWQTHDELAEVYRRKGDPDRAEREYQAAAAILDKSWSELVNSQSKLTFPSRSTRFYRRYVEFLMGRKHEQNALDLVESHRARLLAEKVGESESIEKPPAGTVLLSYWLAPEQSYLWVTGAAGQVSTFPLGSGPAICRQVNDYSKTIEGGSEKTAAARELYDLLLGQAQPLLPAGVRVVLVADDCLHGLNFETLKAPSGRYWVEEATVEIAPSLRLPRPDARPRERNRSILLMGDPVGTGLAALPNAGKEIADIAAQYGGEATKITGPEARPEAYRAAKPAGFAAIHFAAHALPNRESPLDSAVVLSQGKESSKLYAREVQDIALTANLVTVSACSSAGARAYPGEGLVGFAWAFLRAGARHVVASLWDVSDRQTAVFMQSLYRRVHRGDDPVDALRAVKMEFLQSRDGRSKPYYWAPFQVYVQ